MKPRLQNLLAASAALAVVALASASVARADGMPAAPAPTYTPPYSWTGLYIGAQSGWMNGEIKGHTDPPIPSQPFPAVNQGLGFKATPDTGIAGIHIGYQQQWSNIVLGIEGSWSDDYLMDENEGQEIGRGASGICGFATTIASPGHEAACNGRIYSIRDIGPRVGLAKDKWLAYVTGGYAQARINTWGTFIGLPITTGGPPVSPQNRFQEGSATHDGWFIGGGVDYALSNNVFIGLQYKHYEFGHETEFTSTAGSSAFNPNNFVPGPNRTVDASADALFARLDFKFWYQPTPAPLK